MKDVEKGQHSPSSTTTEKIFFHKLEVSYIERHLKTNIASGLTNDEAAKILIDTNPNELSGQTGPGAMHILFINVFNPMNAILGIACAFSLYVQDLFESVILIIVILANSLIGFVQEFKSEKTMSALRQMASPTARVLRKQQIEIIPTRDVVIGDICMIEVGDVVPADLRLVESLNLEVDEALLTGEAIPVAKNPSIRGDEEKLNLLFSSTTVTQGRGVGIVFATGLNTEIGKIATLVGDKKSSKFFPTQEKTPLQISLNRMMYLCFFIACILAIIVFGVNGWIFSKQTLLYAIGVAVAILPEGLPAVVIVTMAIGVKEMATQKAIVRKLVALEALGQVTNICSDKTGTLTEGKMVAKLLWVGERKYAISGKGIEPVGDLTFHDGGKIVLPSEIKNYQVLYQALLVCTFCRTSTLFFDEEDSRWKSTGSPTEVALQVLSKKLDITKESLSHLSFVTEYPFDSSVKRMTVNCVDKDGRHCYFTKGALERVFEVSTHYYNEAGEIVPLTDEFKIKAEAEMLSMASNGWRVLAIADKITAENYSSGSENDTLPARNEIERDMVYIGLIAVYDPPRVESLPSVCMAKEAGIVVHMATGDHPATAEAIAIEVGILVAGEDMSKLVMEAKVFDALSDKQIDDLDELPRVLARCSPASKVKLIGALHRIQKFVCMTGDGVNDAPAVKQADVGIAMGLGGSDVTKQASAITLTDDNFKTILVSVKEGRRIFNNCGKFAMHLLSGNVSEVVALVIGLVITDSVTGFSVFPMSAIQILWLNMITSSPVALALGMEKASADIMKQKPRARNSSLWSRELLLDTFFYGIVIGTMSLCCFIIQVGTSSNGTGLSIIPAGCNNNLLPGCEAVYQARGFAFYCHSILLLVHGYNCRETRGTMFTKTIADNKYLNLAFFIGFILTVPTAYLGYASVSVFHHSAFDWGWGYICLFVALFVGLSECYKWVKRWYFRREN